ncbi:hypothetical protein AVEN_83151-1 [Araneus ventricosus]|uniref:Uncharacterized protein n=1 Tax=Araneus ventricosus TaxID=182803 RepID=A0A4Y2AP89_ARAVE|nr:hypothetical protein AVEN_83151-1 [Araneus ventricosus]
MDLIPDSEVLNPWRYCLPHHGVRKDDSTITKLRVVFNSLNPARARITVPLKLKNQLLTVTYGTACAPFLAMRTLHQLAQDYEKSFPDTAKVIRENFYVVVSWPMSDQINAMLRLT